MTKCVLFSPIGASDPVRQEHDGPMLHIVRHYSPQKIYLYFTKEMAKKKDEVLAALKPFNVKVEQKMTDIESPHDFDVFARGFDRLLISIQKENPDKQILLNISSGTAQMMSALCLEVVISQLKLMPIQVSTPAKGSNERVAFGGDVSDNLDDLMEDGGYMLPNRCSEPDILSFKRSFLKRDIMSLITHYEYRAAAEKLEDNLYLFDQELLDLLFYANLRQNDNNDHRKSYWHQEFSYTKDATAGKACNYYCILKNKANSGELSYFVLLSKSLAEYIAEDYVGSFKEGEANIILTRYYQKQKKQAYRPQKHRGKTVYNLEQYIAIMIDQGKPKDMISKFMNLHECLDKRNKLAHELAIEENVNTKETLKLFKHLLLNTYGNRIKTASFEIYDAINKKVLEML